MIWTMRNIRAALVATVLAGIFFSLPQTSLAAGKTQSSGATVVTTGNPAASEAAARLNKKQYRDVRVSVDQGIATLTGTVDIYEFKIEAEKHVRKVKSIAAVRNLIDVAGPHVSDQELQTKLTKKLVYDRIGYGNTFNAIAVSVDHGVVTVSGHARTNVDKESALDLVATTPGVKGVTNEIEVDPVSLMDNQTRMAVASAIYGYASLNKYAIDPAKPIRISVQNGNVELYGTVDSQADKEIAFIRANGVAGVFSVKNYLQVAGQTVEAPK